MAALERRLEEGREVPALTRAPRPRSGARGPHVHLLGDLVHVSDVGSLVGVRVDARTDQLSELQRRGEDGSLVWRKQN